uniref:Uncharacterized protein n=1 Tax=Panthera leo TaxID=9689 RepID=A0A8C8WBE4_PANLE
MRHVTSPFSPESFGHASTILGFYTHGITTTVFKVYRTFGFNFSTLMVKHKHISNISYCFEGVGDLCIDALILVDGQVLWKVNFVHILTEHWGVIIGIGDLNLDLNGATSDWVTSIHCSQDQKMGALVFPVQRLLQY